MVSSTQKPIATPAIATVAKSNELPKLTNAPSVTSIGKKFVIDASIDNLMPYKNINNIEIKIRHITILCICVSSTYPPNENIKYSFPVSV